MIMYLNHNLVEKMHVDVVLYPYFIGLMDNIVIEKNKKK